MGHLRQADSGKLGDSDCSSMKRNSEDEVDDECLGQVPEIITSPPTASGLYWPKTYHHISEGAVFVPDIGSLHENAMLFNCSGGALKRQRHS
ncbi:hypothetical protein SAY86_006303 [Trapa natans]|uniref:Uncharacterized protein n=1 Tax=Trapa natans TaxID=22666 RepID=A0AAN7QWM9_TRANT|nr:hypothetical protein SAY86_006303 [Trapa natans]